MPNFTYKQFEKAAQDAGMLGQFSAADLALAQKNPDAGMSILGYKQDYAKATTDEARALAHAGTEGIRKSYGNYSGGDDGSKFLLEPLSPSSFSAGSAPVYSSSASGGSAGSDGGQGSFAGSAPVYSNTYSDDIADLYSQQKNYGSYSYDKAAPTYTNRYDETTRDLLNQLINREDFSYDAGTDPLYSQYRKAYTREGQRAVQDAIGAASSAAGGIPSSYAATAAAQAGDYYAAQMADKIPELYQMAYNRWMNDHSMKLSDLGAVQSAEQNDYSKYLNELNQYNTDRSFDYNAWMDGYNMLGNNLSTARSLEQQDYAKYLDALNQYNTDRSFDYGVLQDEISHQAAERQEERDERAWQYQLDRDAVADDRYNTEWAYQQERDAAADDRYAQEWQYQLDRDAVADSRYDTEYADSRADEQYARDREKAQNLAAAGYFSGYDALGYTDAEKAALQTAYDREMAAAYSGGGSGGGSRRSSGGGGSSGGASGNGGILDTMLSYGDDWQAEVYLMGLDLAQWEKDSYMELYRQARDAAASEALNAPGSLQDFNLASVNALGLGPVSYDRLESLIEAGDVEVYTDSNGRLSVRWANSGTQQKRTTSGTVGAVRSGADVVADVFGRF